MSGAWPLWAQDWDKNMLQNKKRMQEHHASKFMEIKHAPSTLGTLPSLPHACTNAIGTLGLESERSV
eukprot:1154337-Pelagomonas_calceolata.AAC.3